MRRVWNAMVGAVTWVLEGLIWCYQYFISPWLPASCRYEPTCSEYMAEAIRKKGPVRGLLKGILRLLRCNPFFPGGYDPVD